MDCSRNRCCSGPCARPQRHLPEQFSRPVERQHTIMTRDRGGEINPPVPDDRRRTSSARQFHFPNQIRIGVPVGRIFSNGCASILLRPAPAGPIGRVRGDDFAVSEKNDKGCNPLHHTHHNYFAERGRFPCGNSATFSRQEEHWIMAYKNPLGASRWALRSTLHASCGRQTGASQKSQVFRNLAAEASSNLYDWKRFNASPCRIMSDRHSAERS